MRYWSPSCIHMCNRAQEDTERLRSHWINKNKHKVQTSLGLWMAISNPANWSSHERTTWDLGNWVRPPVQHRECPEQGRWWFHLSFPNLDALKINPQATALKEIRVHQFCCSQSDFCAKAIVWDKAFFLIQRPLNAATGSFCWKWHYFIASPSSHRKKQ